MGFECIAVTEAGGVCLPLGRGGGGCCSVERDGSRGWVVHAGVAFGVLAMVVRRRRKR
jgi:MYXO-CTERM domain-containing protein